MSFDIETAKILPEKFGDLHAHRPLGITCAATWCTDENSPELFYTETASGSPSPKMSFQDLGKLVNHLKSKTEAGYTILTHNGLGFDFDILAEESTQSGACRQLARQHVDMMFHFFCGKGFAISLNAAAQAIGTSKLAQMDGSKAPRLWSERQYEVVLDYIAQDCELTLKVAESSQKEGQINWITRRGSFSSFPIPEGWLTVEKARQLPLPDTSWMDDPWPRSKFTNWLDAP